MSAKGTPGKIKKILPTKQGIILSAITPKKDSHFIPEHTEQMAETIHDSSKEEKGFYNKEEVALKQEDQKVKAAMVSKSGRKRIFNSQGRR